MLTAITDQINILKYLPTQKDSLNPLDPTTVVLDNRRFPPLDGGQSMKIGGMWTLKHETEIKVGTALDLNNLYNHINMLLNALNRLQEDPLTGYQSINIHSEFSEYFLSDLDQPSYSWNFQMYTSLGHSLVM